MVPAAAATCGRRMIVFLRGLMVVMAPAATAAASLGFFLFHRLALAATATALGFFLAFPDQGFNHFQHHIILCSSVEAPKPVEGRMNDIVYQGVKKRFNRKNGGFRGF